MKFYRQADRLQSSMVSDRGTRERQPLGPRAIMQDIWQERDLEMIPECSTNTLDRCLTFFLSTPVSCRVLAHSCWDDKELY